MLASRPSNRRRAGNRPRLLPANPPPVPRNPPAPFPMTTKRLAVLLALLLGGMSAVFLLPQQLGYQPVGVVMELPKYLGGWWGSDAEVTDKERQVLVDSDFARKNYVNGRGERVLVSI